VTTNRSFFCSLDQFMGDVDKEEIDLDEEDNNTVEDIARFVNNHLLFDI
jgi:hypothetical protein